MPLSSVLGAQSLVRPGVCTSSTRPASPFEGQVIYETDTDLVQVYNGSGWYSLGRVVPSTSGTVLQVVSTHKTDTFTTTSTTYTDITGLSATITPTSTNSKIFVMSHLMGDTSAAEATTVQLVRGSTAIGNAAASGNRTVSMTTVSTFETNRPSSTSFFYLDSPSTTSSTTYKVQIRTHTGTAYVNLSQADGDGGNWPRSTSSITLMEIAG